MNIVKISLIVAVAENGVIGIDNKLPWHLPGDLKYFKSTTMGKPMLMGRKTFESLGKPLPGRPHIIITRDQNYNLDHFQNCSVVHSVEEILKTSEEIALKNVSEEIVIIGGAEIYELMLPMVDRLYVTEVHASVEGDTCFPDYNKSQWAEIKRETFKSSGPNPYDFSFVVFDRIKPGKCS